MYEATPKKLDLATVAWLSDQDLALLDARVADEKKLREARQATRAKATEIALRHANTFSSREVSTCENGIASWVVNAVCEALEVKR